LRWLDGSGCHLSEMVYEPRVTCALDIDIQWPTDTQSDYGGGGHPLTLQQWRTAADKSESWMSKKTAGRSLQISRGN
jgi:hypothetical protein